MTKYFLYKQDRVHSMPVLILQNKAKFFFSSRMQEECKSHNTGRDRPANKWQAQLTSFTLSLHKNINNNHVKGQSTSTGHLFCLFFRQELGKWRAKIWQNYDSRTQIGLLLRGAEKKKRSMRQRKGK